MSTITAFILVGKAHEKYSGIIPTHYISLYESDHPSLSLHRIEDNKEIIRIKPSTDKLIDNIYLLINIFVLKEDINSTDKMNGKQIHKYFNENKENMTHEKLIEILKTFDFKVVFNILTGSTLLNQLERIKDYPNDIEITVPKFRKEYSNKTNKVEIDEF